jgi:hypothetical protein
MLERFVIDLSMKAPVGTSAGLLSLLVSPDAE